MSIIEKAVSKLEEQSESSSVKQGFADKPAVANTVERVAAGERVSEEHVPMAATVPCIETTAGAEASEESVVTEVADGLAPDTNLPINIPFDELHARGMVSPTIPRSRIAEEFRTIKRPLLKNISGDSAAPIGNANLVMVTSAIQGDGKTFTSVSLAISIAMELDKTVLFVDADVARASAGRLLGVPDDSPGLLDVLQNKDVAVEDVLLRTNMPKLTILPTGKIREHSNELLASDAMQRLMSELSQRYADRVIVFDSPPLLLTTEAGVLASFMGQIVFVVAADVTPQHAVTDALQHIGEDKMVGMVLNRSRKRRLNLFGYGYAYGYGYGYGYGREEAGSPAGKTS
jgi:exopolysaccharide/PEP-CTERM locus tyrosine autokinase